MQEYRLNFNAISSMEFDSSIFSAIKAASGSLSADSIIVFIGGGITSERKKINLSFIRLIFCSFWAAVRFLSRPTHFSISRKKSALSRRISPIRFFNESISLIARSFYRAEAVKWLMTVVLMMLIFVFIPIAAGSFFATFCVMQLSYWTAPGLFKH